MKSAWEITLDPRQNQPWVWPVTWQSNSCSSTLHLSSQMPGPACYVTENDLTGKTTAGSQSWFYSFKKCYLSCQAQSREQQCAQCPVYSQSRIDANTHARTCTHTHMPTHTHTHQPRRCIPNTAGQGFNPHKSGQFSPATYLFDCQWLPAAACYC